MASNRIVTQLPRQVKPILSLNKEEARIRVLNLYRAWYRQIPHIVHGLRLPVSEEQMKDKIKELIYANAHVTDIRVIDMLVIKGQMELNETCNHFKNECHVMYYFRETVTPKPKDFISKFLAGKDSE